MKLRNLKIHNIASLENAELDFCSGPLSTAQLFLICGDTGSGKSSILDAVCLALYNKTPRLQQAVGGKMDYGIDNVTAQDPRNLMRRGSTEAYVELVFEGNDGKTYQAGWYARRTRNHTLDKVKRSLMVDNLPVDSKQMDDLIQKDRLTVRALRTDAHWFGITYQEDKPQAREELRKLHEAGLYPKEL